MLAARKVVMLVFVSVGKHLSSHLNKNGYRKCASRNNTNCYDLGARPTNFSYPPEIPSTVTITLPPPASVAATWLAASRLT